MTITWFDAVLIGIMFLSAILALVRGLTREILSLLSWVGGAIAVVLLHPLLQNTARSYFAKEDQLVADISLGVVIFLVVAIIIALLTMRLSDWISDSGAGVLDRTLGFVFGLVRGLLIVVVAFLLFIWWIPVENYPNGVRNAKSLDDVIKPTARLIVRQLPVEIAENLMDKLDDRRGTDAVPGDEPPAEQIERPQEESSNETQYDRSTQSELNQVFQSTQDNQN